MERGGGVRRGKRCMERGGGVRKGKEVGRNCKEREEV